MGPFLYLTPIDKLHEKGKRYNINSKEHLETFIIMTLILQHKYMKYIQSN